MQRIASFEVDHTNLCEGIYVSRVDGDVTTYDMRTCKPYSGVLMPNSEMHSVEHLFATFIRNSEIGDRVIYFGPMGCQTGYYLLVRDSEHRQTLRAIKKALGDIVEYNGEMPGGTARECGNYVNLDLELGKQACARYLDLFRGIAERDLEQVR